MNGREIPSPNAVLKSSSNLRRALLVNITSLQTRSRNALVTSSQETIISQQLLRCTSRSPTAVDAEAMLRTLAAVARRDHPRCHDAIIASSCVADVAQAASGTI